jgi:UDP-3-O-[3-hydroxymyristoyl] N-acetylglucosamine deacetylase
MENTIMHVLQRTVAKPVTCSGVGLHSGKKVNLTVRPAPANFGIKFVRTDLPDSPKISALFNMVVDTSLATVIGSNGCIVSTIEHLMAAFAGLSIDNALVELDSYEVPVMDGSAGPFTRSILKAGVVEQDAPRHFFVIKNPIELQSDGKYVGAFPANEFRITCSISFQHQRVGKQRFSLAVSDRAFQNEICSARTFGFLEEVEYLKRFGLAQGGSLENAVVLDREKILNEEGLRFDDEFVRHKLLDCIGDLSLLGMPIMGHIVVKKSGHAFNHKFLERFLTDKDSWETTAFQTERPALRSHPKSLAN